MSAAEQQQTVLITDYAWPDLEVEKRIFDAAGLRLVAGPAKPASAEHIKALVEEHKPAGILTNWAVVSADAIAASPSLQIVARLGVGLDNIAVSEATQRGIWVTNVPDYCVEEVSDHAIAGLLAWARGLIHFDKEVRAGRWEPASARLRRMSTLTCGIVGFGRIGRRTAQKLAAFGAAVLVHTPNPRNAGPGIEFVSLEQLLRQSDAVILHVPLTPQTHHLINAERIAQMRPGSFIVNVSRGAVIDTKALVAALQSGHLSGAALDVLENEPQVPEELKACSNVILTPHIAFTSDASLLELRRRASEEVVRVLRGDRPQHACNAPAGR